MEIRVVEQNLFNNLKMIQRSDSAIVYRGTGRESGYIFKFYSPSILNFKSEKTKILEKKITTSKPILTVPEIIVPKYAIYNIQGKEKDFLGYQMKEIKGPHYREYIVDEFEDLDLYKYADEFFSLERIIARANKQGFVFPDLATLTNIMVLRKKTERIRKNRKCLIDYDGIQVGKLPSYSISDGINKGMLDLKKYYKHKNKPLYTTNLDKASIIHIYFRTVFKVNLTYVGEISQATGKKYTLENIFNTIHLYDYDMQEKVWRIFEEGVPNEFLGETLYQLADRYNLQSFYDKSKKIERRCLVKK